MFITEAGFFLELNGLSVKAPAHEATAIMLAFASREAAESEFADFLRTNTAPAA